MGKTATKAKINIRPLNDRIVVRRLDQEERTAGGIVLPDTAKEKPQRGEVVAVGIGKLLKGGDRAPMGVQEGDQVIFGKYSGTEVKISGDDYLILAENDVLAKIEG